MPAAGHFLEFLILGLVGTVVAIEVTGRHVLLRARD
jgi:hypothetical protein